MCLQNLNSSMLVVCCISFMYKKLLNCLWYCWNSSDRVCTLMFCVCGKLITYFVALIYMITLPYKNVKKSILRFLIIRTYVLLFILLRINLISLFSLKLIKFHLLTCTQTIYFCQEDNKKDASTAWSCEGGLHGSGLELSMVNPLLSTVLTNENINGFPLPSIVIGTEIFGLVFVQL